MYRGPGWWGDPYRHSLAARGISSRFRMSDEAKTFYPSLRPELFKSFKPVRGEIRALRDLADMMDVADRRRYMQQVPMGSQEAGVVMDMIRNLKNKVKLDDTDNAFAAIDQSVWRYRDTGDTSHLLMAASDMLHFTH